MAKAEHGTTQTVDQVSLQKPVWEERDLNKYFRKNLYLVEVNSENFPDLLEGASPGTKRYVAVQYSQELDFQSTIQNTKLSQVSMPDIYSRLYKQMRPLSPVIEVTEGELHKSESSNHSFEKPHYKLARKKFKRGTFQALTSENVPSKSIDKQAMKLLCLKLASDPEQTQLHYEFLQEHGMEWNTMHEQLFTVLDEVCVNDRLAARLHCEPERLQHGLSVWLAIAQFERHMDKKNYVYSGQLPDVYPVGSLLEKDPELALKLIPWIYEAQATFVQLVGELKKGTKTRRFRVREELKYAYLGMKDEYTEELRVSNYLRQYMTKYLNNVLGKNYPETDTEVLYTEAIAHPKKSVFEAAKLAEGIGKQVRSPFERLVNGFNVLELYQGTVEEVDEKEEVDFEPHQDTVEESDDDPDEIYQDIEVSSDEDDLTVPYQNVVKNVLVNLQTTSWRKHGKRK